MPFKNWAMINKKKQDRWAKGDESTRFKILEERELQKKIRHLEEFTRFNIYTGMHRIELYQGAFEDKSKLRILEWGLEMHYGLLVHITKLEGLRFIKQPGCPPILQQSEQTILKVDKRLEAIKKAAAALRELSPDEADKLDKAAETIAAQLVNSTS